MGFIYFLLGSLFGTFLYIYVPKWLSKIFEVHSKEYEITFTLMYFHHPLETSKKGEYIRMKPITIRIFADKEEEVEGLIKDIVHDNIKIEIDSIEERSGS